MTRQEIIEKLTDLRRTIEKETGVSLDQVEVPIYWVLIDVCNWLGLSEEEQATVLPEQGVAVADSFPSH
jgi:hypothetical protein